MNIGLNRRFQVIFSTTHHKEYVHVPVRIFNSSDSSLLYRSKVKPDNPFN
jgi:hypothetical protein